MKIFSLHRTMTKSIVFLTMLALVLSYGMIGDVAAAAQTTSDTANHWAKDQIDAWVAQGLIKGYPDGTFKPDNNISRAEFMVLVNGAFKYADKAAIDFNDVAADAWYADAVAKAKAAGYISGYPDGTMKPNAPISRQEVSAILARIKNLDANVAGADRFSDAGKIAGWSKGYVGAVASAGYMGGYPDGTFKPANLIKRAEAVVALNNVLSTVTYDQAGTYGPADGTETVEGNVVISVPDVTLQNMVIKGNLTLGEGIGEGDVTLNNITVEGTTFVYGGGENSIIINASNLGKVIVNKGNGKVRIVAIGATVVGEVTAVSGVKLEEKDLKGAGFGAVVITAPATEKIILVGSFEKVQIKAPNVTVDVPAGTTVETITLDAPAAITGTGTIETAIVNSDDVSFETAPTTVDTEPGVEEPTIGEDTSTPPSGGGGGGGTTTTAPTISALTNATISGSTITLSNTFDNLSAAQITVSEASTLQLKCNGTLLGQWDLAAGQNDISLTNNVTGLDAMSTFDAMISSGLTYDEIIGAVDFTAIANAAAQNGDMDTVISHISDIIYYTNTHGYDMAPVFAAIDLPTIDAEIDAATRSAIEAAVQPAIDVYNANVGQDITYAAMITDPSGVLNTVNAAGWKNEFYTAVNFTQLFEAIRDSAQSSAIYAVINETEIFNALQGNCDKTYLALHIALIYTEISSATKTAFNAAINLNTLIAALVDTNTVQFIVSDPSNASLNTTYQLQ